jgi:hypothetical protein
VLWLVILAIVAVLAIWLAIALFKWLFILALIAVAVAVIVFFGRRIA